jgi:hypothetical protein
MDFRIIISHRRLVLNQNCAGVPPKSFFNSIDPNRTSAGSKFRTAASPEAADRPATIGGKSALVQYAYVFKNDSSRSLKRPPVRATL